MQLNKGYKKDECMYYSCKEVVSAVQLAVANF